MFTEEEKDVILDYLKKNYNKYTNYIDNNLLNILLLYIENTYGLAINLNDITAYYIDNTELIFDFFIKGFPIRDFKLSIDEMIDALKQYLRKDKLKKICKTKK